MRLRYRLGGIRGLLLAVVVGIGLFLHLYTQRIITQLRQETRSLVAFYAQMHAKVAEIDSQMDFSFLFDEIILKSNFPLIQADAEMKPVWWRGFPVDPQDRSGEAMKKMTRFLDRMKKESQPIPIRYQERVLGYLVYGDSRLIQQLRWLPYVEVGIVGIFILVGFIGYASLRRSEERHIWVGMAKETAHQLGTPISSLLGWVEMMRGGSRVGKEKITGEMQNDLARLSQVSQRFSQIGSKPDLKEMPVQPVLDGIVSYIRRRVPSAGRKVDIRTSYGGAPSAALNPFLFEWAVENILKNSLDAMDKEKGLIEVRLFSEKGKACIEIEDNGKGMAGSEKKRIFRPGYSTKKRGWGLGLTLARRIIQEYHGGRLRVKETKPGQGTTMRIELQS